ncbi:amidohydrolase family protein [Plastoroseomonas arctica]|uniref:Amidohydrolase family protein n=1 Tax=Plastoroseomonas arctica TaxID=1509237 RepID=A0AAF1K4A3_9PROT|nr:amidohydrolase family protein [Plastoroseomonas arctica]MBR0655929.1 amidohydrolase family protein [Plastoroseomonas arctica]
MTRAILGVTHSPPGFILPPGACDCHTHVFGPAARFAFAPRRLYTPDDALVEDLFAHQLALGLERVVIVQPSPYGTDNAATLWGMRALGPQRARGVAVIGPETSDASLAAMDAAGIRGVRLNLQTAGENDPVAARAMLAATAARVGPLGWHIQVFTNLAMIEALSADIASLGLPVVIDHMGAARAELGLGQPGFAAMLALVGAGHAYVKLSAPHRISTLPGYPDAATITRALIAANPARMLWGSDWPHPGGSARGQTDLATIEPFRPEDDGAGLSRLASWVERDAALLRAILVDNPARLYGF